MPEGRLTALDASFLQVESPKAHMHVGWAATFAPPPGGAAPTFSELRDHVAARLHRAPRYRQRLAPTPLGLREPAWIDDPGFELDRHLLHARSDDLARIVETVLSVPLDRDRPLWEIWYVDGLSGGRVGMVGKAHHCMVDGIAAVELATMLLDVDPSGDEVAGGDGGPWHPAPEPGMLDLLVRGAGDLVTQQARLLRAPLSLLTSPTRALEAPRVGLRIARALGRAAFPLAPPSPLNGPSSALRNLASLKRPLEDLSTIRRRTGTTINDVVLAACAGGLREFLADRGDAPMDFKTMVPVSVRGDGEAGDLGNRISFMFVALPCTEADPRRRLQLVHEQTSSLKDGGDPGSASAALDALAYVPPRLQQMVSRLVSSPRAFNLVVSNIPGPRIPLFLRGCRLLEAYPVVPLASEHALSIGMTTVGDDACFGFYADRKALPDAGDLPARVDAAIDELLGVTAPPLRPVPPERANGRRNREPEPAPV